MGRYADDYVEYVSAYPKDEGNMKYVREPVGVNPDPEPIVVGIGVEFLMEDGSQILIQRFNFDQGFLPARQILHLFHNDKSLGPIVINDLMDERVALNANYAKNRPTTTHPATTDPGSASYTAETTGS